MKKRTTRLAAGGMALLIALGGYGGLLFCNSQNTPEEETAGATLSVVEIDTAQVTRLSYQNEGEEIVLEKGGDGQWYWTGDPLFPVSQTTVEMMLYPVGNLTATHTLKDPQEPSAYGLDPAQNTIQVWEGANQYTLLVGDESTMATGYYLMVEGQPEIYLTQSSLSESFAYPVNHLIQKEQVPYVSQVLSVTVEQEGTTFRMAKKDYLENPLAAYTDTYAWYSDQPETPPLESQLVQPIVDVLTNFAWGDCVTYNAEDLSPYGLDNPRATVTMELEGLEETDDTAGTSDAAAESSDAAAETSDASAESSDAAAESTDAAAESSEAAAETSDAAAETSDASAETSDASAESSDAAAETSDAAAETSDAAAETSDTDAEASQPETFAFLVGDACEEGYYVMLPGSQMVYTVAADGIDTLLAASEESLLAQNLCDIGQESLQKVTVTQGEDTQVLTLTRTQQDEATVVTYQLNGQDWDGAAAQGWISRLEGIPIQEREADPPAGDPICTIVLEQDYALCPQVTLTFGESGQEGMLAARLNDQDWVLVEEESVNNLLADLTVQ